MALPDPIKLAQVLNPPQSLIEFSARFRANFYVEWDNQDDPFYENTLVGKTIKIGEWLEVMIVDRDPRCEMITLDPDTADDTPKILQHLARKHSGDAGVFAAVIQRGRVNKGDPIFLK